MPEPNSPQPRDELNLPPSQNDPEKDGRSPIFQAALVTSAFLPLVAITVAVLVFRNELEDLHTIGYAGVFLANVVGSGSFILPVPGIAAAVLGATLWNPFLVALAGGTGSTVGEIAAYLAGVGSSGAVRRIIGRNRWYIRWYPRLSGWIETRGMITIFIFAAVPNPFFDIAGFAAGSMRYSLAKFLLACWLGKMIKYAAVSYAAYWGADILYGWFN